MASSTKWRQRAADLFGGILLLTLGYLIALVLLYVLGNWSYVVIGLFVVGYVLWPFITGLFIPWQLRDRNKRGGTWEK